jgi:hypothetical protein
MKLAWLCVAAWLVGMALPLAAQTLTAEVKPESSPALKCLGQAPGQADELIYPFDAFKRAEAGHVLIELVFSAPDAGPAAKVVSSEGSDEFVKAVREHVRGLRVPCLVAAEGPVRLRQNYVFKPALPRPSRVTEDLEDAARKAQAACVKHPRGQVPEYPEFALKANMAGRISARMTFTSADQAPAIEIFAHPSHRRLAASVEAFVHGLRMPCFQGKPVITSFTFVFKLEGDPEYGFKPMSLMTFLRMVKGIEKQAVAFDFTTMGCPFDVDLLYLRPGADNRVEELGERMVERKPLLAWLGQLELNLPRRAMESVYADNALIAVPCAKLELTPQPSK